VSKSEPVNLAHSIHQRLVQLSHTRKEDPNHILTRYAIERLLYRLSLSPYADRFILKGAMLFAFWTDKPYRPTRDLDLLGIGDSSDSELTKSFRKIIGTTVTPDGLVYDADSVSIEDIRDSQEYPGKRVKLTAHLGNARLNLQIDIGFGDSVSPKPLDIDFPSLLDLPHPHIRAYPVETVIAEKTQAIVVFDMTISRMKDFCDLWVISRDFTLDGPSLINAFMATFNRRKTELPTALPSPFTDAFANDPDKIALWSAFIKRARLDAVPSSLNQVIHDLAAFLWPPLQAAATQASFQQQWKQCLWRPESG
jgi:hypothetical protein